MIILNLLFIRNIFLEVKLDLTYFIFTILIPSIGFISIIWSIFTRKIIVPKYYIRNKIIVSGTADNNNIEIKYLGVKVPNISSCDILFYNKGRGTIRQSDIAKLDPIVININDDFDILDVKTMVISNKNNGFHFDFDKKQIKIYFEYFNKNDGFIIQVIHSGLRNTDINICGTIVEGKQLNPIKNNQFISEFLSTPKKRIESNHEDIPFELRNVVATSRVFLLLSILLILFNIILAVSYYKDTSNYQNKLGLITFSVYTILVFTIYISLRKNIFPKKFAKYFLDSKKN